MKALTNASAEQLVIGTIIKRPETIDAVSEKIGPHDFHEARIGTIYAAAARLALAGKGGGPELVEELRSTGELPVVGGDKAIAYLEGKATADEQELRDAVRIVRDLAVKREKTAQAYKVAGTLASGGDAAEEIALLASEVPVDRDGWTDLGGVVSAIITGTHHRLEPTMLERSDGASLIYASRLNWISAPPESMKSWLAKLACVQQMEQGRTAVYVDFEESDGTSCAERIVSIALGRGHSADIVRDWVEGVVGDDGQRDPGTRRFYYRAATTGLDGASRSQIMRTVKNRQVPIVVLDGVAAAMSSHSPALEEDKARDVNLWLAGFAWPLVALGAGVLCVDHVAKNNAAQAGGTFASRAPRGSGAKLAAVSGAALTATVKEPGSAWTVGKVDIEVVKDRPGRVKVVTRGLRRYAGTLVSTPKTQGCIEATHLQLLSPEAVAEAAAEKRWDLVCAELASKLLEDTGTPMSKTDIRDALNEKRKSKGGEGWRTVTVTAAINFLVDNGWATMERNGKTQLIAHVRAYTAELGEQHADDNPF